MKKHKNPHRSETTSVPGQERGGSGSPTFSSPMNGMAKIGQITTGKGRNIRRGK